MVGLVTGVTVDFPRPIRIAPLLISVITIASSLKILSNIIIERIIPFYWSTSSTSSVPGFTITKMSLWLISPHILVILIVVFIGVLFVTIFIFIVF